MVQPLSMESEETVDPEEILFDSLDAIFDLKPISVGSLGSSFVYRYDGIQGSRQYTPHTITLDTPDTKAANWHLHASAIWVSSIYLADHISELEIPPSIPPQNNLSPLRILELGASAGLPSILISKLFPDVSTTVTDYPDEALIGTLTSNVRRNDVAFNCRVVPYGWGSDPSPLLGGDGDGFDIIIAADTLWNPELHHILIDSLTKTLKRTPSSRIHLIAGLHTGRYTIQGAITCAQTMDLEIESILEREVDGSGQRPWCVYREGEDEKGRRRWVVWIKLKWASPTVPSSAAEDSESHAKENNYEKYISGQIRSETSP
ncbi:hypothetical protein EST38_g4170 [Candolleomyces aberdarensis]|uniref:Nicotinamide N-methyltransferase n=1 Tax=Candolleomyces aberdarensis TaxID=2316362 RepID=A0A4Q2DNQ4_9AGAR|nr:hypothetical protein EST38_g4170 [Candolleomyces aberdarensis]